jgi:hypothetical protein
MQHNAGRDRPGAVIYPGDFGERFINLEMVAHGFAGDTWGITVAKWP